MKPRALQTFAIRLQADAGTQGAWCALFPRGQWKHHTAGDMEVTPKMATDFIASWKAAGSPPLPITVHHVPDDLPVAERQQAAQAVGWIEDLRPGKGDNALEGRIAWNDDGKALVAGDKYRFLSPEWSLQHVDRRDGSVGGPWLFGAALLNDPFFHSMPRVAASAVPAPRKNAMDKKLICAALKLDENTADDVVLAALTAKLSGSVAPTSEISRLTAAVEASNKAMEASAKHTEVLAKEVQALKASAQAKELAGLEAELVNAKKVAPANVALVGKLVASMGVEDTRKLFASMPTVVAEGEMGHSKPGAPKLTASSPVEAFKLFEAESNKLAAELKIDSVEADKRVALANPELFKMAQRVA